MMVRTVSAVWPPLRAALISFGAVSVLATVGAVYVVIHDQLSPAVRIGALSTSDFTVGANGQIKTREALSARAGCIGRFARVLARLNADGSITEQAVTNIPLIFGVDPARLRSGSTGSVVSPPISDNRKSLVYRPGIPVPRGIEPGFYAYVYEISQEPCGWGHGLLPVQTSITYGPVFKIGD